MTRLISARGAVILAAMAPLLLSACSAAALSTHRSHVGASAGFGHAGYGPAPGEDCDDDLPCGRTSASRPGYEFTYEFVPARDSQRPWALGAEISAGSIRRLPRLGAAPEVPTYSATWIAPGLNLVLGHGRRSRLNLSAGGGWARLTDDTGPNELASRARGRIFHVGVSGDFQLTRRLAVRGGLRGLLGLHPPRRPGVEESPGEHVLFSAGLLWSF